MTPKKLPSAHKKLDQLIQREGAKITKEFNIPPSILGKPDNGKGKKTSWKKIENILFGVIEQAQGKKLYKYQKDFIRAIWKHQEDITNRK